MPLAILHTRRSDMETFLIGPFHTEQQAQEWVVQDVQDKLQGLRAYDPTYPYHEEIKEGFAQVQGQNGDAEYEWEVKALIAYNS